MKRTITTLTLLLGALSTSSALGADAERGAQLHSEKCVACHASRFGNNGNDIYTRTNRRVQNLPGLQKQVNFCKNNLQIVWFDEDVANVVEHLNKRFYHFGQE
jgi:cytochrome c2